MNRGKHLLWRRLAAPLQAAAILTASFPAAGEERPAPRPPERGWDRVYQAPAPARADGSPAAGPERAALREIERLSNDPTQAGAAFDGREAAEGRWKRVYPPPGRSPSPALIAAEDPQAGFKPRAVPAPAQPPPARPVADAPDPNAPPKAPRPPSAQAEDEKPPPVPWSTKGALFAAAGMVLGGLIGFAVGGPFGALIGMNAGLLLGAVAYAVGNLLPEQPPPRGRGA